MRRPFALLFAIGVAGCAPAPTGVVVVMDTNAPIDRALFIHATVHAGQADGGAGATRAWIRGGAMSTVTLPASFGVVPSGANATSALSTIVFDLSLDVGPAGEPALAFRQTARFHFVPQREMTLQVLFDVACGTAATGCTSVPAAQCTTSTRCEERGLTCGAGSACVTPDVQLVARDAGVPEGGQVTLCPAGMTACGTHCVDLVNDPANCGACGTACPSGVPNGTPACVDSACQARCNAGSEAVGDSCDVRVPRPIAPLSSSVVPSSATRLAWQNGAGVDGARIEFCRDRACATVAQTLDVPAAAASAAAPMLAPGVWFWRLRGMAGGFVGARTGPVWQFTVHPSHAPASPRAAAPTVFDADRDGLAEIAITAYGVGTNRGAVLIYHWHGTALDATPQTRLVGPSTNSYFGQAIATADVNGDGYADLLVGAPAASGSAGNVFVYHGSAAGLSPTPSATLTAPAGTPAFYGGTVADAGDVNGDGFDDVLVAQNNVFTMTDLGLVFVYFGGPTGLAAAPASTLASPDGPNGGFGRSLAGVGDVNGDGYADVMVGAENDATSVGHAHLYLGGPGALRDPASSTLAPPGSATSGFGLVVDGADFDDDGFADAVVGSSRILPNEGHAYAFAGGASGLGARPVFSVDEPASANGYFTLGERPIDLNGDGRPDLLAATTNPFGPTDAGSVYVYLTSSGVASGLPSLTLASRDGAGSHFGAPATSPGDVNGDGYDDVLIAATGVNSSAGRVYLYLGGATPFASTPIALDAPDGAGSHFGAYLPP